MTNSQLNDIGTIILATIEDEGVAVDISSATVKKLYIEKPDGTLLTKDAVFTTDGTDGKMQYVVISGDLSLVGIYKVQGRVEMPAGKWNSNIGDFQVEENLS